MEDGGRRLPRGAAALRRREGGSRRTDRIPDIRGEATIRFDPSCVISAEILAFARRTATRRKRSFSHSRTVSRAQFPRNDENRPSGGDRPHPMRFIGGTSMILPRAGMRARHPAPCRNFRERAPLVEKQMKKIGLVVAAL